LQEPEFSIIFRLKGKDYEILRYPKGKGPNLGQAILLSNGRGRLLTMEEAKTIRDDPELSTRFKDVLKPLEFAHVRDSNSDKEEYTPVFGYGRPEENLGFIQYDLSTPARIVILRKTGNEAPVERYSSADTKLATLATSIKEKLPPIIKVLEPVVNGEIMEKLKKLLREASE
jgi:hypothetical protein